MRYPSDLNQGSRTDRRPLPLKKFFGESSIYSLTVYLNRFPLCDHSPLICTVKYNDHDRLRVWFGSNLFYNFNLVGDYLIYLM